MRQFLTSILLVAAIACGAAHAGGVQSGSFVLADWSGPPIDVYYVTPDDEYQNGPVVIVMHGVYRNAEEYAANWQELVEVYGLRVFAPEFSSADFPGAAFYNLGGIDRDGPYAYSAIEPLFDEIVRQSGPARGYYLFGHSAGAQYVHRALLFEDLPRLRRAYSANAGWYSWPDTTVTWPYGVLDTGVSDQDIQRWLGLPMIILLGDQDIDPTDPNLRRTPEAMAQGAFRLERGENFFLAGAALAENMAVEFGWQMQIVSGIAHDNAGMAVAAAADLSAHNQLHGNE